MRFVAVVFFLLLSFTNANIFWAESRYPGWWRRRQPLLSRSLYPRAPTARLRKFALAYFDLLNICDVQRIIDLYADDYSGWEADGDPVDRKRQELAIGYFCLPPSKGGFNGTKFTPLETVQVGPDTIYLRVHIAHENYFSAPFNFSQSLLLTRHEATGQYQIRMEVQSLSGVRLRAAVGETPNPGQIAVKPISDPNEEA